MFKKELHTLKTSSPLRSSERRKLKTAIVNQFTLSDVDGDLLVPEGILSAKFTTHLDEPGVIYLDGSIPVWFSIGHDSGDYQSMIPTVYTLWKRQLLPVIQTPQPVIDKMRGGADLMAPGVIQILPSSTVIRKDELVCVSSPNSSVPLAVGQMAKSSDEVLAERKGKAVITLHTYGDVLWERGGKGEPPPQSAQTLGEGDVDELQELDEAPVASTSAPAVVLSPEQMDDILRSSLFQYLSTNKNRPSFPLSASKLYSEGIIPSRPLQTQGQDISIKNSSYKKLKPFLKAIEKSGVLKLKEIGGDLNVISVDFEHPDIVAHRKYKTIEDEERKEAKAALAIEESIAARSGMVIVEYYKPHGNGVPLFQDVGASTSAYYTLISLRDDVLSAYISKHSLLHPTERSYFVLDDALKSALLTKRETEEYLARDDGLRRLMESCQPYHEVQQEMKKGKLKPINISIKLRQGKKSVTLITGHEAFSLVTDVLCEDLRKLCAAQTSVSPVPGKTSQMEVLVQGKQGKAVSDYLMQRWGIPKKWIELEDTTEKKKGK